MGDSGTVATMSSARLACCCGVRSVHEVALQSVIPSQYAATAPAVVLRRSFWTLDFVVGVAPAYEYRWRDTHKD